MHRFGPIESVGGNCAVTTSMLEERGALYMRLANENEIRDLIKSVEDDRIKIEYCFDKERCLKDLRALLPKEGEGASPNSKAHFGTMFEL